MMRDEFCPLCTKQGLRKKMLIIHINFAEAVWMCENEECIWPFGDEEFKILNHPVGETRSYVKNQTKSPTTKAKEPVPIPEFSMYTPPATPGNENSSKRSITDTLQAENLPGNYSKNNELSEYDTSMLDSFLCSLSNGDDTTQNQANNTSKYNTTLLESATSFKPETNGIVQTISSKSIPKVISMKKTNMDMTRFKSQQENSLKRVLVKDLSNQKSDIIPTNIKPLANHSRNNVSSWNSKQNTKLVPSTILPSTVLNSSKNSNVISTEKLDKNNAKETSTPNTTAPELSNTDCNFFLQSDYDIIFNGDVTNNSNSNQKLENPEQCAPQIETVKPELPLIEEPQFSDISSSKKTDVFNNSNTDVVQTMKLNDLPPITISYKNPETETKASDSSTTLDQSCTKPNRRKSKVNNAELYRKQESDYKCYEKFSFNSISKKIKHSADNESNKESKKTNHINVNSNIKTKLNNNLNMKIKAAQLQSQQIKSETPMEVKLESDVKNSELEISKGQCREQSAINSSIPNNDNISNNDQHSSDSVLNASKYIDDIINDIMTTNNNNNVNTENVDNDWLDYFLI